MQPVAELGVFDIADEAVDQQDRLRGGRVRIQIQIGLDTDRARLLTDRLAQAVAALGVQTVRVGKLVEQRLKMEQPLRRAALLERRRDMAQRHRTDTPLGLGRLARVVDDEGIDDRQGPDQGIRPAVLRQRHRLARKPLQRAVSTDMDQSIHLRLLAQPEIKSDIAVTRRATGIVVFVLAQLQRSALGLQRDQHRPAPRALEVKGAPGEGRIVFRRAPALRQ